MVAASKLKQLCKEGQETTTTFTVFEATSHLGGVWKYKEQVEESVRGCKLGVGSPWIIEGDALPKAIYSSLKTNLPHILMQFRDVPFDLLDHVVEQKEQLADSACQVNCKRSGQRSDVFVAHADVLDYLCECAEKWDITRNIKFNTSVVNVEKLESGKWSMELCNQRESKLYKEEFDYVLVANGHFTDTYSPLPIEGLKDFPHPINHSQSYRHPQCVSGNVVLVVGTSWSGQDLVREMSHYACKVYWSSRSGTVQTIPKTANHKRIEVVGEIAKFNNDGSVKTRDGYEFNVAQVFFATGYLYSFPFLQQSFFPQSKDHVPNLEMQMFLKSDPTLMFLGLPRNVSSRRLFSVKMYMALSNIGLGHSIPSDGISSRVGHEFHQGIHQFCRYNCSA